MPEGWAWCKFSDATLNRDSERKPVNSSNRKNVKKIYDYYGAAGVIDKVEEYLFDEKLLLIGEDGANLLSRTKNNAFIANGKYWVNNHAHVIDCFDKSMLDYLCHYINSLALDEYITGSAQPKLTQKALNDLLLPLPPLKEQIEIVSTIEKAFSQINLLEQNKTDLHTAIKQAKSKILDLAIHGKLVPQDPSDETAEELLKRIATSDNRPYKKLSEDEAPFLLPKSWQWCRMGDLCVKVKRGKSPKYIEKSNTMAFAQKCNQKDGPTSLVKALFIDESTLKKYPDEEKLQFNDIVINSTGTGTLGRVGIFNCEIPEEVNAVYPDSHVTTVRFNPSLDKMYCYYFVKTKQQYLETMGEGSTNQKELKPDTISNMDFPLPPIQEQHRIVAKIEEIFNQLDIIYNELD